MKYRAIALAAGLLAAHTAANAWFFFIPTGAIVNAVQGGHCVSASAKAGDTFKSVTDGRMYVINETNGTSSRCANPDFPVVAKASPYFTEAELREQHPVCLAQGAGVGATTTVPGLGEVQVVSVDPTGCSDMVKPISARVVRVQAVQSPAPPQARLPEAPLTYGGRPIRPVSDQRPAEPSDTAGQPQKSVADRLRELKQLRDENLITQELYEAKQKEILSSQ